MNKKSIKENEFSPAPGGMNGTVNYQTPLNTHSSPDVEQEPEKFNTADNNKAMGQTSNTAKDFANPEDMAKSIDQIYSKKTVPTSDQVKSGFDYELHNMIKPDKQKAKEIVLTNLRKDPNYYKDLHFLNIDDKHMDVPINEVLKKVNPLETKKIFDNMTVKKDTQFVVNQGIVDIMKDLWAKRNARPKWKKGDPTL